MDIFDKCQHIFTISSCSGRITIVDTPYPWTRKESTVVFKKHEPISLSDVISILNQKCSSRLWLIASGPILHFVADSIESATRLLNIARSSGFKHSGIISIRDDGIVVEIISGTWTSTLLKDKDILLVPPHELKRVIEIFNEILMEGKKRLQTLRDSILKSSL